jgi:hypothetical protein
MSYNPGGLDGHPGGGGPDDVSDEHEGNSACLDELSVTPRLCTGATRASDRRCAILAVLVLIGTTGFLAFSRPPKTLLKTVDAAVVLAGEHDGRQDYGLQSAPSRPRRAMVLSDPYPANDDVMRSACNEACAGIEVPCGRPLTLTTAEKPRWCDNSRSNADGGPSSW